MDQVLNTDTIEYPETDTEHEIFDRVRKIRFKGRMIGKASTQREGGGPRWTDITIYATAGGNYVIQREGISLVYHKADSSCRGGELVRNEDILEDSVPCPVCRPPDIEELDEIRETSDPYRNKVTLLERKLGSPLPDSPEKLDYDYIARLEQELGIGDHDLQDVIAEAEGSADPNRYRREVTMSSADVADDPHKIVPILTYQGRLTSVATEAIERARMNDSRFSEALNEPKSIA